jgi:hypothetical protein
MKEEERNQLPQQFWLHNLRIRVELPLDLDDSEARTIANLLKDIKIRGKLVFFSL